MGRRICVVLLSIKDINIRPRRNRGDRRPQQQYERGGVGQRGKFGRNVAAAGKEFYEAAEELGEVTKVLSV
jgi:hypothetical protein